MSELISNQVQPINLAITSAKELAAFCAANNLADKAEMLGVTVNTLLLSLYGADVQANTGHVPETWKTFKQWKEGGYSVIAGEKSFRVWSAPDKKVKTEQGWKAPEAVGPDEKKEKTMMLWHTACLFRDGQVGRREINNC